MTLSFWLRKYYQLQDKILLCYRPTDKTGWADRVFYLSEEYDPEKPYNHRNILTNEVVIEFDTSSKEKNNELANKVCERLSKDNISFAKWYSGNKSYHVHCLINVESCRNVPLLKNVFMRYYTKDLPLPDLRLCAANHLIRCEYGIHETTGKNKTLITKSNDYPKVSIMKREIWEAYYEEMGSVMRRKVTTDVNNLVEHPGLKWILTAEKFREADDGRERALFMLIHVLKPKYVNDKEELVKFLQDWYRYSGGTKLSPAQIKGKVYYHWNRSYNFGDRYINDLLAELGKKDLVA